MIIGVLEPGVSGVCHQATANGSNTVLYMASRRNKHQVSEPRLVNLTPHPITILDEQNRVVKEIPSHGIARARQSHVPGNPVVGIPTARVKVSSIEKLPEPAHGVLLIVSLVTATAAKAVNRWCGDLLVPGPMQRDEHGVVLGCRELIWFK